MAPPVNKAFVVADKRHDSPIVLILTDDNDGPRDQATLLSWYGEQRVSLCGIPAGWDDESVPVYLSLSHYALEVLDIKIDKENDDV